MIYYSISNKNIRADFRQATIEGQASDGGLFFPAAIPQLKDGWQQRFKNGSAAEMALEIMQPYIGETLAEEALLAVCERTMSFPIPLKKLDEKLSVLELFHGPTAAFKDVGARFMSGCLSHFAKDFEKELTILVATSGDTGGAVADGFFGVEGVKVVILYPSGKVSPLQEAQLTGYGGNVQALEVDGSFDDCQRMVKAAFADPTIRAARFLTSANSINVARWLPQQLYYFSAYLQSGVESVWSVPSGNFGNLCAGMLARQSGMPVKKFIAACNANDTIPRFLQSGVYEPHAPVATISNAMDVAQPSNFIRILELFNGDADAVRQLLQAVRISDEETSATMREIYDRYNYLPDPHTAVGIAALKRRSDQEGGIVLSTAHPSKFNDVVAAVTGRPAPLPPGLEGLLSRPKNSIAIPAREEALRSFLLDGKS